MNQKIGYISVRDLTLNPQLTERFKFIEATFTRTINSRGDRIRSKILCSPVEYEEIVGNANIMKKNPTLILVREPFLLDDELRERCISWVERSNTLDHESKLFKGDFSRVPAADKTAAGLIKWG